MSIKRRDQEFRFPKVSYIDYKQLEMDRVLTMLFPRVKYRGYGSRRKNRRELKLEDFISVFQQHDQVIVDAAIGPASAIRSSMASTGMIWPLIKK